MILEGEIKDAKMSSFSSDFQTRIKHSFPLYFHHELLMSLRSNCQVSMEYLIRNRPHATLTITIFFFGDDTYAVVNIDNKGPKNFTQHPSVILLIPPKKKKNFAKAKLVELSKKWT